MSVFEKFTGENGFAGALTRFIDLVFVGFVWLAVSLPAVTLGASSAALYYTVVKVIRHERGRLLPSFFASFRANFRPATLALLAVLGYAALGCADLWALAQLGRGPGSGSILYDLNLAFFIPAALALPWLFAYISRFENSLGDTLRCVFVLLIRNFPRTLLLLLILGGAGLICWLIPELAPLLPGPCCLLMSLVIEPVFRALTAARETDSNADPWYNE